MAPRKKNSKEDASDQEASAPQKPASSKVATRSKTTKTTGTGTKTPATKPKSAGKANTGATKKSAALPLSAAEAKLLKELQSRMKASEGAALQQQHDELVRKRNAEMLAAEQSDHDGDDDTTVGIQPAPKKTKDQEEDLDGVLGDVQDEYEEIDGNSLDPVDDANEQDVAMDEGEDGNGINMEDGEEMKPSKRGKHPISRSISRSTSVSSACRDKLTKNDFSPRTTRLANAGKSSARERVAFTDAFPKDKDEFVWESIQHGARDNNLLQEALQLAQENIDDKELLIEYVGYAIAGLRGDLKLKAKNSIAGHYGIPGKMSRAQIEDAVRWLLEGSKFTRGELNVEDQAVVNTEPFGHAIIADIIRSQWFGKGKADILAFNKMVALGKIPEAIIILVVSAVENALMEWSSGEQISMQFSDDVAASRYAHHKTTWNVLKEKTPTWTDKKLRSLFHAIMKNGKRAPIQAENKNDLDDINFEELERSAKQA